MSETLNVNVLVAAKEEYTKQLIDVLKDRIYDGFQDIYIESKSKKNKIDHFRKDLESIPKWNQEVIELEQSKIINNSKCDWLDDLITAVYICHTKILTIIGPNKKAKRIANDVREI